jgi:hopanoid-associated phosphorylase
VSEAGDILVVVGMTREAKILGDGAQVLVGGGDMARLAERLEALLGQGGISGLVSFGLCGALDPALKVGDLVLGESVADPAVFYDADRAWAGRLAAALPAATCGRFASAEKPVGAVEEKAALRSATGALAVDLESFTVARLARDFGVPFAVIRAVSDDARHALPHAATVGLGADGRPAVGKVLASLRDHPWQIGALIRTALEAEDGFHALERACAALGPRLAGPGAEAA